MKNDEMIQNSQLHNNSGFTLIELLVALAISGIVIVMIGAFMTNGSKLYQGERDKINLQNELQVIDGYLTEIFQEAKTVDINVGSSGNITTVYTGVRNSDKSLGAVDGTAITTEKIITYDPDSKSLYVSKSYVSNLTSGYLVSQYVSGISFEIDESCKRYESDTTTPQGYVPIMPGGQETDPDEEESSTDAPSILFKGYQNPIYIKVTITIEDENGNKKEDSKVYRLRNDIDTVTVNGSAYTVK